MLSGCRRVSGSWTTQFQAKAGGLTSPLKLELNPSRVRPSPWHSRPAQSQPPPRGLPCPARGNPTYPAASQISRFKSENLVVVTMSKDLLGCTATQTQPGRTDLPSGASRQYNLPSETAYSMSLLMNIRWCFVLAGCSHGSARLFHFRDRIGLAHFAFYSKYIYPASDIYG